MTCGIRYYSLEQVGPESPLRVYVNLGWVSSPHHRTGFLTRSLAGIGAVLLHSGALVGHMKVSAGQFLDSFWDFED